MTYPESANVSAGDGTLASHYNNLRADGVFLGQVAADSVPLGTLLERYESRLELELLDTTKIRVPASATAPVSLLIDGYLCQAVADVDLDGGEVPAGGAAAYYIFANRTGSSTTFTLTVNTSSTEAADQRRIGRFYWDGSKIIKDSVRSEHAGLIADLLYFTDPQICNGRLTLSTLVPAPDSEISSSANVYFTPYLGNRVALYVQDYGWRVYSFSELTLDISGIADAKNIDVWIYDNAGTLTLAYTEWSNDTLRATALVRQDGVLVKTGALGYRYLGTIRTSGAGVTCDTKSKRFVWNYYNRVLRHFLARDDTNTWTYTLATWRAANNDTTFGIGRVGCVIGVAEDLVNITVISAHQNGSSVQAVGGIGIDSVSANSAQLFGGIVSPAGQWTAHVPTIYKDLLSIGYHYIQRLEISEAINTTTWVGDMNTAYFYTGLIGEIKT